MSLSLSLIVEMETFTGTITKVTVHPKVTKVLLDNTQELLYFKGGEAGNEDASWITQSNASTGPLKDKHIPIFVKGQQLKATCAKFGSPLSWAIREITVYPPTTKDMVGEWMAYMKSWLMSLKDARKPKNPETPSLSKMSALFIQHYNAFHHMLVRITQTHRDGQCILLHAIHSTKGDDNGDSVLKACHYAFTRIQEVYERAARFHRLKEDVYRLGYANKITDAEVLKAVTFCENYELFRENPFETYKSKKQARIAFAVLDTFAIMYGLSLEKRVFHTVWHCMHSVMASEGHTCFPLDGICTMAANMLKGVVDESYVREVIKSKSEEFTVWTVNGKAVLYLGYVYGMERYVAKRIKTFVEAVDAVDEHVAASDVERLIQEYEEEHRIGLHELQRQAIHRFMKHDTNMHILTGLPGTGKSSVVKCIWYIANRANLTVTTCAPTGKAANRLGSDSSTIHRTLEVVFESNSNGCKTVFMRNETNSLDSDIVIVDEVSMLDMDLCYHLFKALPQKVRVLFLGDENQLPSVNYGDVLRQWLEAGIIPHTHLTKIFRQGDGSIISKVAKYIVKGVVPPGKYLRGNPEVEWIELNDPMHIHRKVLELYLKHTRSKEDTQILIPTKRGDVGTLAVNSTIHRHLFKEDANEKVLKFKPGEKILVIANSYAKDEDGEVIPEKSVFNGENGIFVEYANKKQAIIQVDEKRVALETDNIEMGYAFSIHKSQGSEYPIVIMVLHGSHSLMLNKEVIYTGITRAKKKLYLIGSAHCIEKSVRNECPKRYDCLARMIRE